MQFYCIGGVGVGEPENQSVSGVSTIASRSAKHLLRIESIRLLFVACGMFVHFSSMAVRSCWILSVTGTRCHINRSRSSQTCSMGSMSGEYIGHARIWMFSASRNCVHILAIWGRTLSCCNMRWWWWGDDWSSDLERLLRNTGENGQSIYQNNKCQSGICSLK